MKGNARQYTESLLAAQKEGRQSEKYLVKGLVTVLQKKRQTFLLKEILNHLTGRAAEEKGEVMVVIEMAHEPEASTKKALLAEAENMYPGKKIKAEYRVVPALQSGFRIRGKEKELDRSFMNQLNILRKNITHV